MMERRLPRHLITALDVGSHSRDSCLTGIGPLTTTTVSRTRFVRLPSGALMAVCRATASGKMWCCGDETSTASKLLHPPEPWFTSGGVGMARRASRAAGSCCTRLGKAVGARAKRPGGTFFRRSPGRIGQFGGRFLLDQWRHSVRQPKFQFLCIGCGSVQPGFTLARAHCRSCPPTCQSTIARSSGPTPDPK